MDVNYNTNSGMLMPLANISSYSFGLNSGYVRFDNGLQISFGTYNSTVTDFKSKSTATVQFSFDTIFNKWKPLVFIQIYQIQPTSLSDSDRHNISIISADSKNNTTSIGYVTLYNSSNVSYTKISIYYSYFVIGLYK